MTAALDDPVNLEGLDSEVDEPPDASTTPPGAPIVAIRPGRPWPALNIHEVWAYRELLYFLMWRDIKVRYKQTALGFTWAVIQPLLTMLIFTLFFGGLARLPSDGIPYPLFAYAGLLPWMFVSTAVTGCSNSLAGNPNLISKVYFPRLIVPMAATGAPLVDLGIGSIFAAILMAYYGVPATWSLVMLPALVTLTAVVALGVGMLFAALNVKYRDVRHALPFLVQLWMFLTPIIYPSSLVPQRWRWLLGLNPLSGIIEAYRACVFGRGFNWSLLAISSVTAAAFLTYSAYAFRRMEKSFADII